MGEDQYCKSRNKGNKRARLRVGQYLASENRWRDHTFR